jgi:hypothetical protein
MLYQQLLVAALAAAGWLRLTEPLMLVVLVLLVKETPEVTVMLRDSGTALEAEALEEREPLMAPTRVEMVE